MNIEGSRELRLGIVVQANISDDGAINDKDAGMNMIQIDVTKWTYAMMVLMTREVLAWNVPVIGSSDVSTINLSAFKDCRSEHQMYSVSSYARSLTSTVTREIGPPIETL